jgi:linoleoyl-CoA desaturase
MASPLQYKADHNVAFQQTLNKRVKEYFRTTGQRRSGNGLMAFKVFFFLAWMVVGYALLYTAHTFGQTLLGYFLGISGVLLTVITTGHDASHQALFRSKRLNKLFSWTWGLLGLSTYFWEAKHHHSHHHFTNIIGYDQDLSQSKLIRFNPRNPYYWFHRYQRFYAPFLYLFFGFFAVTYREFKLYGIREYGVWHSRHGRKELLIILLGKVYFFMVNLILPLVLIPIPAWQIVLCFVLNVAFVGLYIVLVLAIPHINLQSIFKESAPEGTMEVDWFTHAIEVTVDASPDSWLVNWFTGGLNTHVVHHLFPGICHIHYRALTPIVAETAREYGLPYKETTFPRLIRDHFRMLAELGKGPHAGEAFLKKARASSIQQI